MKVVILVHGPDFACSENLSRAFALRGDTRLISLNDTDWRNYDPGLLVSDETQAEARALVEAADLVVLGDAPALHCLARLAGPDWIRRAGRLPLMPFFGDTFYFNHPDYYDGLLQAMGLARLFLLPNLMPLTSLEAIPLHHPMPIVDYEKTECVSIMHSPGRDGKAIVKGTAAIESVIELLRGAGYEFDYYRLMHMTLAECLAFKGKAHIVIDQLPPLGLPRGLGRSGLEALAAGSVVLTDMYSRQNVAGYFPIPPVVPVHGPEALERELKRLLDDGERREKLRQDSRAWAVEHIKFDAWLGYVERYL